MPFSAHHHNQKILDTIEELKFIANNAHSGEQMLDSLAKIKDVSLVFDNRLTYCLICVCIGLFACRFILPAWGLWWGIIHFVIVFVAVVAYFSYHSQKAVIECIALLENKMIKFQYHHLDNANLPVANWGNPILVFASLKRYFQPLFRQGKLTNEIINYSSTLWHVNDKTYPVLIFQYQYSRLEYNQSKAKLIGRTLSPKLTFIFGLDEQERVHHNQWGMFIFDVHDLNEFVVSTENDYLSSQFHCYWQERDVFKHVLLNIRGENDEAMTLTMTPQRKKILDRLFAHRRGHLQYNAELSALCFLNNHKILKTQHRPSEYFTTTSRVRGHLRKLKLLEYEQLQQELLAFIENNDVE